MRVLITGATGFIGKALCERLAGRYEIVGVSRNAAKAQESLPGLAKIVEWQGGPSAELEREIDGAYAIVNLAGESIGSGRWTKAKKARVLDSRIDMANALIEVIGRVRDKPKVFVQTSAIGYYGHRGDEPLDEASSAGTGFLSDVCQKIEAAAQKVEETALRYVAIRTGIVLGLEGGALPKMMLPFKLFLGGHAGRGDQWISWISLEDETAAIEFLIENEQLSGPFNLTAPSPVTARQFARTLGRVMKRPSVLPAPAFVLKIMLGEMAEELLLSGQRVIPSRLKEAGFEFSHTSLQEALNAVLS